MTNDDSTPPVSPPTRRRAVVIASIAGGVVVLGGIAALVVSAATGGSDDVIPPTAPSASTSASPSASPSPSASTSVAPSPDSTSTTPDERFGVPVATEVATDEAATLDGATITIDSITTEAASGQRAGETAGLAVRVVVRVTAPAGGAELDLSSAAVRAYTGLEFTPASPVDEGTGFTGALAAGDSTTGTYVFTIPEGSEDSVSITVGLDASSGLAVFTP